MKKKASIVLLVTCLIVSCLPVSAREVSFTKKFVDSNEWSFVAETSSDGYASEGAIYMNDMFASDAPIHIKLRMLEFL